MSVFDKTTRRFITAKTSFERGIETNPERFSLSPGVFLDKTLKNKVSLRTARKRQFTEIILPNDYYLSNGKIYKDTPRNKKINPPSKVIIIKTPDIYETLNKIERVIESNKNKEYQLTIYTSGGIKTFLNVNEKKIQLNKVIESLQQGARESDEIIDPEISYEINELNTTPPREINQRFRDGKNHCVLHPIRMKYIDSLMETTGERLTRFYQTQLKKLDKYEYGIYRNGIPEHKLQEVADDLQVKIIIDDFLGNLMIETKSKPNTIYRLHFRNTKLNHAEYYTIKNPISITTQKEMLEILKREERNFYIIHRTKQIIYSIETEHGTYQYENEDKIQDFNESIGFQGLPVGSPLGDFVNQGVHITSHCFINRNADQSKTYTLDMSKAYAQYKHCSFYQGFPMCLSPVYSHNFTLDFVKEHIGYYRINNLQVPEHLKLFNSKINVQNDMVLFSPEILFYSSIGYSFDIVQGTFTEKPIDFDLPEYFFIPETYTTTQNGKLETITAKPYQHWAGRLMKYDQLRFQELNVNPKFMNDSMKSILRQKYPDIKIENQRIYKPNPFAKSLNFIGGAIAAYTRIQVLQELLKYNLQNVVCVCLDGITIINDEPNKTPIGELWKLKPSKYYPKDSLSKVFFCNKYFEEIKSESLPENINQYQIWLGQGGTGKTHSFIHEYGQTNSIYTAPTNSLVSSMYEKWKPQFSHLRFMTIHSLLSMDSHGKINNFDDKKRGHPHNIFIDESTMITNERIDYIQKRFPYSKIIIGGDLNDNYEPYQCKLSSGCFTNPKRIFTPRHFLIDRRSLCDSLKELKLTLRDIIDGKQEIPDTITPSISIKDLRSHYNHQNDSIVCHTNSVAETITESLPEYSSYIFTKCVRYNDKFYNTGDILKQKEQPPFTKKRLAFTTHSFQGKTIEEPSRLFIVLERGLIRDATILYTAISRVRRLSQLVFVSP